LVEKLRAFIAKLPPEGVAPEVLETAVAFILCAPKARQRAARWVGDPDASRAEASRYIKMVSSIAQQYRTALVPKR
jgi:hypothetical protein